ncbi:MAG: CDP-alcohol phosphatidyltransferase family protein [Candidatus Poribacteria bacterium]|nr:CDP-alcohol phosphatidyltransferase family protein [Candidatus Poribacteria bacterium]
MKFPDILRLANLLTFSRLLLTLPFFLCFRAKLMIPAAVFFSLAGITDYYDGKIARKRGTTSFGSFIDSVVDKILVAAALICFYLFQHENLAEGVGLIPIWMVLVILGRELIITVFRVLFVAMHGEVISANRWGKYKTAAQLIVIIIGLVLLSLNGISEFVIHHNGPIYFMMYLPLVLTVVSGIEILYGNLKTLSV